MSYHDFTPESREGKIGQAIYMHALDDRSGFRGDKTGIEGEEVWTEVFEDMGHAAIAAVASFTEAGSKPTK
ncbi:MAG: hypothetical protein IIB28_11435 [Chloroflexi bacterium]|nr:hypothetical protein [Chloroflexota bacterium]